MGYSCVDTNSDFDTPNEVSDASPSSFFSCGHHTQLDQTPTLWVSHSRPPDHVGTLLPWGSIRSWPLHGHPSDSAQGLLPYSGPPFLMRTLWSHCSGSSKTPWRAPCLHRCLPPDSGSNPCCGWLYMWITSLLLRLQQAALGLRACHLP